jgi:template-activating factor I
LYPRVIDEEAEPDELPAESGSFFNFFEIEADPFDVSVEEIPHGNSWLT